MVKKRYIVALLLTLFAFVATAQNFPEPMQPVRMVNDFAGLLTSGEQVQLESKLVAFSDSTSTQIAVASIESLDGLAISDYAQQLFDKWGVGGSSKNNNGILILVKPKTADGRGEVFIATGYGVEGVVPDALAGRIVDYDILPAFRKGHYYEGIDRATTTLIGLTRGEFTAEQYLSKKKESGSPGVGGIVMLALLVLFLVIAGGSGKSGGKQTISSGGDVASAILLGSLLSGGHRSSGGGFGGFSGGGGGFGGFGGGFSGGGGAGGSW